MKLGVIGTGKMGAALIRGIIDSSALAANKIYAYNRSFESLESLKRQYPDINLCDSAKDIAAKADIVLLSVKPQGILPMLADFSHLGKKPLFVSIAAGVSLASMEKAAGKGSRIIRTMPNTPALIGKGAIAYSMGSEATEDDANAIESLFKASGMIECVAENLIDAISAISGSGPAYMYVILEALSDAGVALGLPRETAARFATQTMLGSAELARQSGRHFMELKDEVTSPGGSTIEALNALDKFGLRHAMIEAVKAACARAKAMGKAADRS